MEHGSSGISRPLDFALREAYGLRYCCSHVSCFSRIFTGIPPILFYFCYIFIIFYILHNIPLKIFSPPFRVKAHGQGFLQYRERARQIPYSALPFLSERHTPAPHSVSLIRLFHCNLHLIFLDDPVHLHGRRHIRRPDRFSFDLSALRHGRYCLVGSLIA